MDLGGGGSRSEAEEWLSVAEKLLDLRDLEGSKRFAERAMEADPLLEGVDQILAVADVLLASRRRVNNHVDWYAVLQLPSPSTSPADAVAINRQYRHLALLLHADRNKAPGSDAAFRLVSEAFGVLSDPTKKSLFDAEIHIANSTAAASQSSKPSHPSLPFASPSSKVSPSSSAAATASDAFWTACTSCCYVHQYPIKYLNRTLRCPNCRRDLQATQLSAAPPIVPGTDMYYCSWGFFPMGFPGAPSCFTRDGTSAPNLNTEWQPFFPIFSGSGKSGFFQTSKHQQEGAPNLNTEWRPFSPMFSGSGKSGIFQSSKHQQEGQTQLSDEHSKSQNNANKDNPPDPQSRGPVTRSKKMAVKKVRGAAKESPLGIGNYRKTNQNVQQPTVSPESWGGAMPIDTVGVEGRNININQEFKISSESEVVGDDDYSINFHIDVNATDEILDNLQNLPFLRDDDLHMRLP